MTMAMSCSRVDEWGVLCPRLDHVAFHQTLYHDDLARVRVALPKADE